jgi:L-iditol 2-dehydrogenase
LTYADGALLEPLSVVLHGFERSPVKLGEATVICGAGPIGLVALAVAKASGAAPLVITDLDAARLQFAEKFVPGAIGVQIELGKTPVEMAKVILRVVESAGGLRPRVVYECTGVQSSVVTSTYLPRPAGEVRSCSRDAKWWDANRIARSW